MKFKIVTIILLVSVLLSAGCSGSRPEIISFTAVPDRVNQGEKLRLSWKVNGADSVSLDNILVQGTGSVEVTPDEITAYNLTAKNTYGTIVSSKIINVVPVIRTSGYTEGPQQVDNAVEQELADEHVYFNDAIMVGADEHYITLHNNLSAHNPSWKELIEFLKDDLTDKQLYRPGIFTCGDFAEMLHNNAEKAGIRAAIVAVELNIQTGVTNHSLNAFETTDRGIVYIDATSSSQGLFADKIADVAVDRDYIPCEIFSIAGRSQAWSNMGCVQAIDIFQW